MIEASATRFTTGAPEYRGGSHRIEEFRDLLVGRRGSDRGDVRNDLGRDPTKAERDRQTGYRVARDAHQQLALAGDHLLHKHRLQCAPRPGLKHAVGVRCGQGAGDSRNYEPFPRLLPHARADRLHDDAPTEPLRRRRGFRRATKDLSGGDRDAVRF